MGTLVRKALETMGRKPGQVTLRSGLEADHYWDVAAAMLGAGNLMALVREIGRVVDEAEAAVVAGPALGAVPLIFAALFGARDIATGLIVRPEGKGHGDRSLVVGPEPFAGARCLMVEDVVTTGSSLIRAAAVVRTACPQVRIIGAHTLILRQECKDAALKNFKRAGLKFQASYMDTSRGLVEAQDLFPARGADL